MLAAVKRNEIAGAKTRSKRSDVVKSAEKNVKSIDTSRANRRDDTSATTKIQENKVKSAAKGAVEKAKASVKSGVKKARNFVGSALGKLADKVKTEGVELDSFDTVVAYLIDEEIASDFDEANSMMTKLSAETISEIHESQMTYITEISAQLAHTASMKADEVARKARISGDKETAAKKVQQASRIYKGVGPRRAKERMEKEDTDGKGQERKG